MSVSHSTAHSRFNASVFGHANVAREERAVLFSWRHLRHWLLAGWLTLLSMLVVGSALAQTQVSGAIAVDTRWTVASGPYVINGDFVIQNGALLTIDPGVTIYMAANSGLTIQSGGIKAAGTVGSPIRILSDKTRLGQAAAPGDWKQWVFNAGTTNTQLDYVGFEHGRGLAIKGSAPVLNNLTINNQLGAAITLDLAASPAGVGNKASGNTINGIVVPAGDISGDVKWKLTGIPYLLASGTVSVGASPSVTSLMPNVLQQGDTTTISITGSRLSGLTSARFENAGLNAEVLAGASDTLASLSVTAQASAVIGSANLRLLATAGEVRVANALSIVQAQPTLTSLAPATIYVGQGTAEVTLNGRNFTNQSVALVNGIVVATQFVSATQVRASIAAPAAAGNLAVRLRTPDPINAGQFLASNDLVLPVAPAQLVVTPSPLSVVKGAVKTYTVTLPYPAPTGGLTIALVSSVPNVATLPASVIVPEGQSSASFQVMAADLGNTVLTASKLGFISGQAQVTVVPPPTLTLSPSALTLGVGRTAELTIQSSVPAGAGGLVVTLGSSNTGIANIPASLTIPAGASTASVSLTTVAIGTASVTAQATDFVSGSASVIVRPISLNMPAASLVAPGLSRSIPITLSDPAPTGGLVIALTSSNSAIASVPASLNVPAGQTSANFTLSGVAAGSASINATAIGYQSATLPVSVEAVTIGIGSSVTMPVDISLSYSITLSRPAPAGGVVINLAMADASKASVSPSSITIAEGQTSGGVSLFSVTGVAKGTTTLTASAAGLTAASVPVTVTGKPDLAFSTTSVTVGKGLKTYYYEVYVYRRTDGNSYSPNQALTVNLASSDATKASVPATVTIPAGSASTYFYVTGVDLTNGTPVTIDATATGYTAPATKLASNVVAPVFNLTGLEVNRSPSSVRDDFYIYVTTPGANYSGSQTAAVDMPINLSVVNGNPTGIVDGFYSAQSGGSAITQLTLRANNNYSDTAYVGVPTAAGSYKVQTTATGVTTATSAQVNVTSPELRFSTTSVTVGKGLKTYYYEVYVYRAVNGTSFSGTDALTVNLTCSSTAICQVPASVVIPAGSNSAYFLVEGVGIGNSTVTASAVGYNSVQDLAINVIQPQLNFSGLGGTAVGGKLNFSVYLTSPGANYSGSQAAANQMTVNLTSSSPGVATVPASVQIQTGNTSSDSAQLAGVAAGTTTITASGSGMSSITSGAMTITP